MKIGHVLLAAAAGGLFSDSDPAIAQTWTQITPITDCTSIACSADGSKLVAAVGYFIGVSPVPPGPIYVSQDAGLTWTATSAPLTNWVSVASSADGTKLVAAANGFNCAGFGPAGLIYTSSDSGATWLASSAPETNWCSVASSADGTQLAAAVGGSVFGFNCGGPPGLIYTSTNSGAAWTVTAAPVASWNSIASSADGSKLVAAGDGRVYTSTNSGFTWETTNTLGAYVGSHIGSVACSADGTKFVAGTHNLFFGSGSWVYTSTNSGATWEIGNLANNGRDSVACSADGTKLVVVAAGTGRTGSGLIITSTNCGATWAQNSASGGSWSSVASSADGTKLVAVDNNFGIYTSQSTPTPKLNIEPAGANFVLSWTVPSIPFALQENSDLSTTNWTDAPTPPTLNLTNLQNQVTVPPPSGNRFYRLKH